MREGDAPHPLSLSSLLTRNLRLLIMVVRNDLYPLKGETRKNGYLDGVRQIK